MVGVTLLGRIMSSGESSIHIGSISGGNNIIGKNEGGQHNHFGPGTEIGTGDLFDAIEKSLPAADVDNLIEEVIDPLEAKANLPVKEQTEAVKAEAQTLIDRLMPYAPTITETLVTLGEAGLSALATTNPIVAMLVASLRAAKGMIGRE